MDGVLYSVYSRSHIHIPGSHLREPSEASFATSPEKIPLPPPYPGDELNLCVKCRNIELDGQTREYFDAWKIYLGELLTIINTRDCSLCRAVTRVISPILTPSVLTYAKDEANLIHVLATPEDDDAALKIKYENTTRNGVIKSLEPIFWEFYRGQSQSRLLRIEANSLSKSIISSTTSSRQRRTAKQLRRGRCDLKSIRNHLQRCLKQHGNTCNRSRHDLRRRADRSSTPGQWPEGFRVIDVKKLRVMPAPAGCSYLALSYVWDHNNKNRFSQAKRGTFPDLCKPQGISISRLPQTIADAIFVCQQLGERYLWVDALCIIQDDPVDKIAQITCMGEIYSLAKATIIAACGYDASKGLTCLRTRDPEQTICSVRGIQYIASEPPLSQLLKDTLWYTRSWTYQEYFLSKRLVVFTSSQAFFVCSTNTYSEDTIYSSLFDERGRDLHRDSHHYLLSWAMTRGGFTGSSWNLYSDAVSEYTRRQLTVASDRLPAISGIIESYGRYGNDAFFCGLPAKYFSYSLLWQPSGESKRFDGWPSWSWVGWTGYVFNPVVEAVQRQRETKVRIFSSSLKHLRFRGEDGVEVPIDRAPGDEGLMGRYRNFVSKMGRLNEYLTRSQHKRSRSKRGTEHLVFIGQTRHFSLAPDPDFRDPTAFGLHKYRIYASETWIGTIFLTAAQVALYPTRTDGLEFLRLTRCVINIRDLTILLRGFGPWDTRASDNFEIPQTLEPGIFDANFYKRARNHAKKEIASQMDSGDPAKPTNVHLSYVMLFERVDDVIERQAVGLVLNTRRWSKEEKFCLV